MTVGIRTSRQERGRFLSGGALLAVQLRQDGPPGPDVSRRPDLKLV